MDCNVHGIRSQASDGGESGHASKCKWFPFLADATFTCDRLLCFVALTSFTMRHPHHKSAHHQIVIHQRGTDERMHWSSMIGAMRAYVYVRCLRAKLSSKQLPVPTVFLSSWVLKDIGCVLTILEYNCVLKSMDVDRDL